MRKKMFIPAISAVAAFLLASCVHAQDMKMYVNNSFVVRDIQDVAGFDMLPVLDIAGELGFQCSYNGSEIQLFNAEKTYTFIAGSASVYDESGNWYGLDVAPQEVNGKIRVPAKFFCDVFGMSYVWDYVTNTLFMNSEDTYNWLINTAEYIDAKTPSNIYDSLSPETRRNLNIFLSNFGEAYFSEYNCNNINNDEMITFAFIHSVINSNNYIKFHDLSMGFPVDRCNETLNKYFGITVPLKSGSRWYYDGSYFWTSAATGETYDYFCIALDMNDMKNGTYIVNYKTYYAGYESMDNRYYIYNNWDASHDSELKLFSSGQAVIKPVIYDGKSTWQLLRLTRS